MLDPATRRRMLAAAKTDARRAAKRLRPYLSRLPQRPAARRRDLSLIASADRLVASPVFVMSSIRSGSTLLRVLLNSHSRICAPHELHLRNIKVNVGDNKYSALALDELGLDQRELEILLWDRLFHRELQRSGKDILVEKTPQNVRMWRRIHKAWPEARFIFLIRHPGAIADSVRRMTPDPDPEVIAERVMHYARLIDEARATLPGLLVRYEDLCTDPARVTREICEFLGVKWEPSMLNYGEKEHGSLRSGIGDWSKKIRSGEVQAPRPLPSVEDLSPQLVEQARAWGYL